MRAQISALTLCMHQASSIAHVMHFLGVFLFLTSMIIGSAIWKERVFEEFSAATMVIIVTRTLG